MDYGRRVLERSPGNLPDEDDSDDEDRDIDDDDSDDDDSDDDDSDSDGNSDDEQKYAKFVQLNRHTAPSLSPSMWESPRPSAPMENALRTNGDPYRTPTKQRLLTGLTPNSVGSSPATIDEYARLTAQFRDAEAKASAKPRRKLRVVGSLPTPVNPKGMSYQAFASNWAKEHGMTYREALQDPEQKKARDLNKN